MDENKVEGLSSNEGLKIGFGHQTTALNGSSGGCVGKQFDF